MHETENKPTAVEVSGYTTEQVNAGLVAFNAMPDTATKAEVRAAVDKAMKPKPRIVAAAVDSDGYLTGSYPFDLTQPDLLDTLRFAVYGSHTEDHMVATDVVMREICDALGLGSDA